MSHLFLISLGVVIYQAPYLIVSGPILTNQAELHSSLITRFYSIESSKVMDINSCFFCFFFCVFFCVFCVFCFLCFLLLILTAAFLCFLRSLVKLILLGWFEISTCMLVTCVLGWLNKTRS